jgi:hypothetical protein
MKRMSWTKRITISSGLALASLVAVPAVAGAAGCYPTCTPSTVASTSVLPPASSTTHGTDPVHTTAQVNGSSSLPFTGADVGELAVIGAGAVAVGVVLTRRRRNAS